MTISPQWIGKSVVEIDVATIVGVNHFQDDLADHIRARFDETDNITIIGAESYSEKFVLDQFNLGSAGGTRGEIGVIIASSVADNCKLALVDNNWGMLEKQYNDEKRSELLNKAKEQAGIKEIKSKQDRDLVNKKLKKIDENFYYKFIVDREVVMAQKIAWLIDKYPEADNILIFLGESHIYTVADYVADILNNRHLNTIQPDIYNPDDLHEFIYPTNKVYDLVREHSDMTPPNFSIKMVGKVQNQYRNLISKFKSQ